MEVSLSGSEKYVLNKFQNLGTGIQDCTKAVTHTNSFPMFMLLGSLALRSGDTVTSDRIERCCYC